ncbi:hypothetical protein, partial [Salmonella sp. SAL4449]|uniref:hypothetical protein n=1 Tax=Salmonella sp. SAL4449 TaxID=3159904 RepID=UPI003979E85D
SSEDTATSYLPTQNLTNGTKIATVTDGLTNTMFWNEGLGNCAGQIRSWHYDTINSGGGVSTWQAPYFSPYGYTNYTWTGVQG